MYIVNLSGRHFTSSKKNIFTNASLKGNKVLHKVDLYYGNYEHGKGGLCIVARCHLHLIIVKFAFIKMTFDDSKNKVNDYVNAQDNTVDILINYKNR